MSSLAQPLNNNQPCADAVLEGGGVRGIGHVGALTVAEEKGYSWVNVAGTSAGAFVAAMMAAGYSAKEMYGIMRDEVDFHRFAQDKGFNGFFLGEAINLLRHGGLHSGDYIVGFMKEKLGAKQKQKFGDLIVPGRKDEPKDSKYRYGLIVIASDISTGRMLRLPQDVLQFGLDPDELDIALAVRMSASIPFFFIPVDQRDNKEGRDCRIVDGGLLSNFPVSIFDVQTKPSHPTFGLRLVDSLPTPECPWPISPTNNVFQIGQALLSTMLSAHDRLYMDDHTFVRTITVPVNGISGTQFNLSKEQKDLLYQNGRNAAEQFFSTWNFDEYIATYRSNLPPEGRRERLHEHMKRVHQMLATQGPAV
jgi:NTE family protein